MKYPAVQYTDYLSVDVLTSLQKLKSVEYKRYAHDEHLFIIIHQVYELWFKQILFELDSILELFNPSQVDEKDMGTINGRLERIKEILRVLNDQVAILETMTPLDFLDFRDLLYPASGFQSEQFRLIENKLGLQSHNRQVYNQSPYEKALKPKEQERVRNAENAPNLFKNLEKWLERTPFLRNETFNFWQVYQERVSSLLERDKQTVLDNSLLSPEDIERNLKSIEQSLQVFDGLFNREKYSKLQEEGYFRLSYEALHGALFISLYRDEPVLQMPFRLIRTLQDIDELLTTWRYRHALMAHRMIGQKIGTGGSSGHSYLKKATESHKIYSDFFNLSTFLIPRRELPILSKEMKKLLHFRYIDT